MAVRSSLGDAYKVAVEGCIAKQEEPTPAAGVYLPGLPEELGPWRRVLEGQSRLDIALRLAELGLSVIPLHPYREGVPKVLPNGDENPAYKKPKRCCIPKAEGGWKPYQEKKATPEEIRGWWEKYPGCNFAIVCGVVSGTVAVDCDDMEAVQFALKHFPAPVAIVKTGRDEGGYHFYYRHPGKGAEWLKQLNDFRKYGVNLEVRTDGHYDVAPGSIHPTGREYEAYIRRGGWNSRPEFVAIDLPQDAPTPPNLASPLLDQPAPAVEAGLPVGEKPRDPEAYIRKVFSEDLPKIAGLAEGERNTGLNRLAFNLYRRIVLNNLLPREEVDARILEACSHMAKPLPAEEVATVLASAWKFVTSGKVKPGKINPPQKGRGKPRRGGGEEDELVTENSLALEFELAHSHELRYDHHRGKWYRYTGARWQVDEKQLAFNWVREVVAVASVNLSAKAKAVLQKAGTAKGVERFATALPCFAVTSEIWDRDKFLLGTPHGTIDLHTGIQREASQLDYITKLTAVDPAPASGCPKWLAFLEEATGGDPSLQRYMQQIAGYALTGDITEHILLFIYGPGGNGKSVFVETLSGIMADYGTTAAMDTFTASRNDKHPTDLASLKGARLIVSSETEEGRMWDETRIKQLTGGDTIAARFMRQDFFRFKMEGKIIIVGNHKPNLKTVDPAIRRRLHIIPFTHTPARENRHLTEDLKAEWPAILGWMIKGCLDWQANGFVVPASVNAETDAYFAQQDLFTLWLAECCDTSHPDAWTSTTDLFKSWMKYAEDNGEPKGSSRTLSQKLQKRGFQPYRKTVGRGFSGIALLSLRGDLAYYPTARDEEKIF